MTDDEVLLTFNVARAGNQDAWKGLVDYLHGLMNFWCWHFGGPGRQDGGVIDVNDIVASAWLRFFSAAGHDRFATGASLLSYLKRCVQTAVLDRHRRTIGRDASDRIIDADIADLRLSSPNVEAIVLARLAAQDLLSQYAGKEQEALLDILAGLSPREAASTRNLPVETVYALRTEVRRRARLKERAQQ